MRILPQSDPVKTLNLNLIPYASTEIAQGRNLYLRVIKFAFLITVLCLWTLPAAVAAEQCLTCHGPDTGMVNSKGQPITVNPNALAHSVHKDLGCLDCHAGAAKEGHTAKTASATCITCHDDVPAKLSASAHAMLGDPKDNATCISCHGDQHSIASPTARGVEFCATCHQTEVSQYNKSVHGRAHAKMNGDAATCQSCHGTAHEVVASTDPKSPVSKVNLPDTCGKCHSNPALAAKYMFAVALPVEAYKQSVHGRAILAGNLKAASCNDCHGVHDILPASDPHSRIWKQNVASTCAQCHKDVFDVYKESIHGKAVAAGVMDAPPAPTATASIGFSAPGTPIRPCRWPMFRKPPARAATAISN